MDNLNNNLSSFGRKRIRQTPSPLNCPVIKKKARGFWIDQLLEDKQQPVVTVDRNNYLKSPESPAGTSSTLLRRGRKSGKSENFTETERKISPTERESPPLDDHNWLPAKPKSSSLNYLKCELENREIWEQFDQLGTEMIITKSGRRMFPVLRCRLFGTLPGFLYLVYLDLVPVEKEHRFRYAYNKSQWQRAGKAERAQFGRLFPHPDNPIGGDQLAQNGQIISFDKVKLTNNAESTSSDQLQLNSMHKYRPRVHVFCIPKGHSLIIKKGQQQLFNKEMRTVEGLKRIANGPFDYKTFLFESTTFVAVTAYQNQLVTQKKIELNPFAKGFRDQKNEDLTDERIASSCLFEPSEINKQSPSSSSSTCSKTPQKRLFPTTPYLPSPFRSSPFPMLSSIGGLRWIPNLSSNTQIALQPYFRVSEERRRNNNILDSNGPLMESRVSKEISDKYSNGPS